MSRWRPPAAASTPIITHNGYMALQAELDSLWRLRRPCVVKALASAAAEGDRSENAEYQYRKKELAQIDRRVRYLGKRIPQLKVAPDKPANEGKIYFGAWIEVENLEQATQLRWRIVGADETDRRQGRISIDSPIAQAMLGRSIGDEVQAQIPTGTQHLRILAIRYTETPD